MVICCTVSKTTRRDLQFPQALYLNSPLYGARDIGSYADISPVIFKLPRNPKEYEKIVGGEEVRTGYGQKLLPRGVRSTCNTANDTKTFSRGGYAVQALPTQNKRGPATFMR